MYYSYQKTGLSTAKKYEKGEEMKKMNRKIAHVIGIVCAVAPVLFIFMIGWMLGLFSTVFYAVAVWIGVYLAWNIGIVNQKDWQCIERFGQFYEIKLHGIRFYCLLGLVDTIKTRGNLLERKRAIFDGFSTNGKLKEIDFTNGSAPIEGYMWYKNGREDGTDEEIKEDIIAYVYTNENPEIRVSQIAEDRLRPKFQEMDVDTASKTRAIVINGVKGDIANELNPYGLYFSKEPPIVIADIGLTDTERNFRQERLRGQTMADETESEADGYRRAIEAIMYRTKSDGTREDICNFETAANIWREQQTRKMFEKTRSNITVIGKSADGVVKTFNVNTKKGG
ncbi:MAG: hypothetical protein V1711_02755 [bacterium]